jgi:hypothetical protein
LACSRRKRVALTSGSTVRLGLGTDRRRAVTVVRIRRISDLRFYLYISRAKIDMLYDQMFQPSSRRRLGISVGAPAASASLQTESEDREDREGRLREVEEELRSRELVGTIEEPKDYVEGTMPMRWGLYDDCGRRPEGEPALVYFGGFDKEVPLMVGLGGSSRHVVGYEGASGTWSRSNTAALVPWLLAAANGEDSPKQRQWWSDGDEQSVFQGMAVALHYLRPPTQNLRFLARRLLTGTSRGDEHLIGVETTQVILASPLFVLQADSLPDVNQWGLDDGW